MTREIRFRLEALAFGGLLVTARFAPRKMLLALGGLVGSLGYYLDGRHRIIGADNLRRAFGPELEPAEARRILRACWRHFGRITLDTLQLLIETHTGGDSWVDIPDTSLSFVNGLMVVSQTKKTHKEIEKLLRQLRRMR